MSKERDILRYNKNNTEQENKMSKQKLYAGGKKIKIGQIWNDICDIKYSVLQVFPDSYRVSLKRHSDNAVIEENCTDLVAACSLYEDTKNSK